MGYLVSFSNKFDLHYIIEILLHVASNREHEIQLLQFIILNIFKTNNCLYYLYKKKRYAK